ncbi:S26 family signal peptidase [Tsuneonella flava]|uniref:S26 family signal peptidase n=1 Tax=Tsuneonella flava TaxID=2055955 RepID=A0ABX7K7V3_9SPHN|nr:S26 family signal peptidase [Tsuneonella flava]QSB44027.1 S26 family signal peptidase [Tsuneonella flava]
MRKPRVSRLSRPAPAPLLEWDPPLARQLRARRRPVLAASMIGLALLGLGAVLDFAIRPAPRLVWNASASAPVGLWRIDPHARLHTGDMVLARSPRSVRTMAAKRRYLPANVPLLKRIADTRGRPLPWWNGCERLRGGRVLLLMDAPDSFDGRYFGPVDEDALIGKATPLWLR